MRSSLL